MATQKYESKQEHQLELVNEIEKFNQEQIKEILTQCKMLKKNKKQHQQELNDEFLNPDNPDITQFTQLAPNLE